MYKDERQNDYFVGKHRWFLDSLTPHLSYICSLKKIFHPLFKKQIVFVKHKCPNNTQFQIWSRSQ